MLDPTDAVFVTGTEEEREAARRRWHRERFAAQVAASSLEQLDPAALTESRFGITEHRPSGRLYKIRPDQLIDLDFAGSAVAYYMTADNRIVLLELPSGAQSRQAADEQQAERERRRNQPKEPPAWIT
jgi:hypothetical protein